MKLKLVGVLGTPANGSPAFYQTDRGTYVIQGWKVGDAAKHLTKNFRPNDEDLIEVPEELIHLISTRYKSE